MKLTESLSLEQQQLLIDGVMKAAATHGIIKESTEINRASMVLHLLETLGEQPTPRKKIIEFNQGIIYPKGRKASLRLTDGREVDTSVIVTEMSYDRGSLTWFETLNTIYIMAADGHPAEYLGVKTTSEE